MINVHYMENQVTKVQQFRHECNTWKRILEFMIEENAILKMRLAEVVKDNLSQKDWVDAVDQYQGDFVREDELIRLVRHDVAELDLFLQKEIKEDGLIYKSILHKQKHLRKEMEKMEKEFNRLQFRFNNFLGEVL